MLRLVNNFGQAGFEGLGVDEGSLSLRRSVDGHGVWLGMGLTSVSNLDRTAAGSSSSLFGVFKTGTRYVTRYLVPGLALTVS